MSSREHDMELIRKYPLSVFYIIAVGIALAVNLTLFRVMGSAMPERVAAAKEAFDLNSFSVFILFYEFGSSILPLGVLFPLAPTLAALMVALCLGGWKGIGVLLGRLKPWRAGVSASCAAKTYFTLFLGGIAYFCAMIVIDQVFGSKADIKDVLELARLHAPGIALTTFFFAVFTDMGAVNEELGWRGFAYSALLERFSSPLNVAILLGLFWGIWHLPREILALITGATDFLSLIKHQISFYINSISLTIIMVYFVNLLGGSIWPAIFIHGLSNYTGEMTRLVYVMNESAAQGGQVLPFLEPSALVKLLIAISLVLCAGSNLGLQSDVRAAIRLPFIRRRNAE